MHTETLQALTRPTEISDEVLMQALEAAQERFNAVRIADPRRVTLGYHDAKLALNVLAGEQRRRRAEALVTMTQISSNAVRYDRTGTSRPEADHSADLDAARARTSARISRTGDPFLGAAAAADEPW